MPFSLDAKEVVELRANRGLLKDIRLYNNLDLPLLYNG